MVNENNSKETQLLGYSLTPHQDALVNYLLPAVAACLLYKFIIAGDICVIFRHYKDGDPIWASLTLFFMYLPALGSYILIISDWDYWPEPDKGMTNENLGWCFKKTVGHLFFPIWSIWRFAERIFWSIEAVRSKDEESINSAISTVKEPRLIEFYVFLQAYLHSLPQVLLQLHILMRHNSDIAKESKDSQVACIIFNLFKIAITTTYYQRFKTQKLTGSQYPWLKTKKILRSSVGLPSSKEGSVVMRRPQVVSQSRSVIENTKEGLNDISRLYNIEPEVLMERRRSSDIYLEPDGPVQEQQSSLLPENQGADSNRDKKTASNRTTKRISFNNLLPARLTNRITTTSNQSSNPSFDIKRLTYVKGLEEDNLAGKLIAFLWWFTFLLSRVLAISVFYYFFPKACVWLLIFHFIVVVAALLYDVKSDDIKRDKTLFFIFIGLIYIFCIIEFKIKFKKAYVIYFSYFGLVFLENFAMCLLWYILKIETLESDYWYRYMFYITIISSFLSLSSMIFYHIITKPKSVLLPTT